MKLEVITFSKDQIPQISPFNPSIELHSPNCHLNRLMFIDPDVNGCWQIEEAYKRYCNLFHAQFNSNIFLFENLKINGEKLFSVHPKLPFGVHGTKFKNFLFSNCLLVMGCLCGVQFLGCRFENCHIVEEPNTYVHRTVFYNCSFDERNCVFGEYAKELITLQSSNQ